MQTKVQTELILGHEDAYQVIGELEDKQLLELAGVDIHTGKHSRHGAIRVVVPPMGDCVLLLPIVLQAA
jgi:hypothetical protein